MPSTNHTHHFEALDRRGRCPHRLKASGGMNGSFECAMVGFDDVVQVFAGPVFCVAESPPAEAGR
jgi:hypothetical protein